MRYAAKNAAWSMNADPLVPAPVDLCNIFDLQTVLLRNPALGSDLSMVVLGGIASELSGVYIHTVCTYICMYVGSLPSAPIDVAVFLLSHANSHPACFPNSSATPISISLLGDITAAR